MDIGKGQTQIGASAQELDHFLENLGLTQEQRGFVESMYQDNTHNDGVKMTSKQLRLRYGLHGNHKEMVIAWDGCEQVNTILSALVNALNLQVTQSVNLIEHGIDDVFFFDEVSNKWEEIPTKWLVKA